MLYFENPEDVKKIPSIADILKNSKGVISCISNRDGEIDLILDKEQSKGDRHLLGYEWGFNGEHDGLYEYIKKIKNIRVSVKYK